MSNAGAEKASLPLAAAPGEPVRILLPLDGSDGAGAAIPYAAALAGPGGTIVLLTVISPGALTVEHGEAPLPAAMNVAARELRAGGFSVETRVLTGKPADIIVQSAANGGADMIVMASQGRGAVGRLLHGSVADRVAREATTPVMVVRAEAAGSGPAAISRLVVPLDGSPLSAESLPVAASLAERLGLPISLARVVNIAELMPPVVGMGDAIPYQIYDETEAEMEKAAGEYLDGVASTLRARGIAVRATVLSGSPASAIIDATQPGDIVVLCSHERSGVLRWLMGSVAEQLVRGDDCPVILVPASNEAAAGEEGRSQGRGHGI